MSTNSKDTIYIDVDEEITGIVSKVQNSPKDIVALVLPKRANVLQSIVNMKLLKRASDQHNKKLVLITSEARILPLAGSVGLFVASNLTSKPYIPPAPKIGKEATSATTDGGEVEIDPNTPVEQVAPGAKFADNDDNIEIDNTPKKAAAGAEASKAAKKGSKNKKFKVPNFSSFRKKMILAGVAGLVLIFGLIYGIFIAPKAKVIVKAQTNELPLNLDFIADTKANEASIDDGILRASSKEKQENKTEKVEATGQKNKGNKASGSVEMTARKCGGNPFTAPSGVAAGTGVSINGVTFITQSATNFSVSGADTDSQGCYVYPASNDTAINAQSAGVNGNVNNASFSVAGRSDVNARGSASGGTDNIVKVVSQSDIDRAKERLNGATSTTQDDFKSEFQRDGYFAINESFKSTPGQYSISPGVDAEANEVTVSVPITYSMVGIKEDDLKELIKKQVNDQQDGQNQSILSEGLAQAVTKPSSASGLDDGQLSFTMDTNVIVGPDINHDELKSQIVGKKSGEAENILKQRPGVQDPKVEFSPFWVNKVPKKHSKITIEVQQADGSIIP